MKDQRRLHGRRLVREDEGESQKRKRIKTVLKMEQRNAQGAVEEVDMYTTITTIVISKHAQLSVFVMIMLTSPCQPSPPPS